MVPKSFEQADDIWSGADTSVFDEAEGAADGGAVPAGHGVSEVAGVHGGLYSTKAQVRAAVPFAIEAGCL